MSSRHLSFVVSIVFVLVAVSVVTQFAKKAEAAPLNFAIEALSPFVSWDWKERVDWIAEAGFDGILSFNIPGGVSVDRAKLTEYADYLDSKGLKIIWVVKGQKWWDGTYTTDQKISLINFVDKFPATYGYQVVNDDPEIKANPEKAIAWGNLLSTLTKKMRHSAVGIAWLEDGTAEKVYKAGNALQYFNYAIGKRNCDTPFGPGHPAYVAATDQIRKATQFAKARNLDLTFATQISTSRCPNWPTTAEMVALRDLFLSIAKTEGVPVLTMNYWAVNEVFSNLSGEQREMQKARTKALLGGTTPPTPDTIAPTTPANLTASASSPTQVRLTWSASTDNVGVTGYRIERCTETGISTVF